MNNFTETANRLYDIYPVPQTMIDYGGIGEITEQIHIISQADLQEATLPRLQDALAKKGYTCTISDDFAEGKTNIYLADEHHVSSDLLDKFHSGCMTELNRKEGCTLIIDGKSQCSIAIIGSDRDGIHYGVVTLDHILRQSANHTLSKCIITDYPEIPYRGYIEGFYGYPWSHQDRIDLMKFGGDQKLNTYIYAPKDAPYHRKHWRELYPADKAEEISGLAAAGHMNHLNFVWTIHPGDSIDLASEEDFQAAIHKLEQLYTLGVRQFGVLFDDLVGIPNAAEQAMFINRIDTEFVKMKHDIRPLITVGTRYCEAWGPSMTEYFKPFIETLHDDVEIMWTGAATMSNISKEQYDSPKRQTGTDRNLSVWWNYPVNDYCDSKILMGKIENLSPDLDNVNGFFANPMNQPQASKQALFCIADHNWNTDAFNASVSFSASFKAIAPEVAEDLELFASNTCYLLDDGGASGDFLFDESWEVKDDVREVRKRVEMGQDPEPAASKLLSYFIRMETAADRIREKCLNDNLVKELNPFLDAFKLMAQAGQDVILAVGAMRDGDLLKMERHLESGQKRLNAMESCKVNRLKDEAPYDFTVDVGTHVLKPFISEMIVLTAVMAGTEQEAQAPSYNRNNIALSSLGVTAVASSSVSENENASKTIDGIINSGKWCSSENRPYVTADLKEPKQIKQYRIINCGHPEARETKFWNTKHAIILASQDGEHFTQIDEVRNNRDDIINRILDQQVTARYFRLQIVEPAQNSVDGSGHTRIYAFELYDERYPEPSAKVPTSDIQIEPSGRITIGNVKKGDVISLFRSLHDQTPLAVSEAAPEDGWNVVIEDVSLQECGNRIFVQRTSRHSLPSVRTSKGI